MVRACAYAKRRYYGFATLSLELFGFVLGLGFVFVPVGEVLIILFHMGQR